MKKPTSREGAKSAKGKPLIGTYLPPVCVSGDDLIRAANCVGDMRVIARAIKEALIRTQQFDSARALRELEHKCREHPDQLPITVEVIRETPSVEITPLRLCAPAVKQSGPSHPSPLRGKP